MERACARSPRRDPATGMNSRPRPRAASSVWTSISSQAMAANPDTSATPRDASRVPSVGGRHDTLASTLHEAVIVLMSSTGCRFGLRPSAPRCSVRSGRRRSVEYQTAPQPYVRPHLPPSSSSPGWMPTNLSVTDSSRNALHSSAAAEHRGVEAHGRSPGPGLARSMPSQVGESRSSCAHPHMP